MELKGKHIPIRYHNRNHIEEEQEELAIVGSFEEANNVKELSRLLREGKLKDFYQVANKVLRIKKSHPVVSRVKREVEGQDPEIFEDRQ